MSSLNMGLLARATSGEVRTMIYEVLRYGIDSGEGLDGRAAELVAAMLNLPGEDYTDGECLDLVGFVIDQWRELDL